MKEAEAEQLERKLLNIHKPEQNIRPIREDLQMETFRWKSAS